MTRGSLAVLAVASLAGCFESHDPDARQITGADCIACHETDHQTAIATRPVHSQAGVGTTCGDCHGTVSWMPAIEGPHPDEIADPTVFRINAGSPHGGIQCLECHSLAALETGALSRDGANTDCNQCHRDTAYQRASHVGHARVAFDSQPSPLFPVTAYAYRDDVPNFCLSCHSLGTARKHDWRRFPAHHGASCTSCHIRNASPSRGEDYDGINTSCIERGCHSVSSIEQKDDHQDGNYRRAKDPITRPRPLTEYNFCRAGGCHPDGRKDD
jgi:hypothetical protein